MPLTCGVPLGVLLAIGGFALYALTGMKRLGRLMISGGIAIALFSLVAVLLAVNSGM